MSTAVNIVAAVRHVVVESAKFVVGRVHVFIFRFGWRFIELIGPPSSKRVPLLSGRKITTWAEFRHVVGQLSRLLVVRVYVFLDDLASDVHRYFDPPDRRPLPPRPSFLMPPGLLDFLEDPDHSGTEDLDRVPDFCVTEHELIELAKFWMEVGLDGCYAQWAHECYDSAWRRQACYSPCRIHEIARCIGISKVRAACEQATAEFAKEVGQKYWKLFVEGKPCPAREIEIAIYEAKEPLLFRPESHKNREDWQDF